MDHSIGGKTSVKIFDSNFPVFHFFWLFGERTVSPSKSIYCTSKTHSLMATKKELIVPGNGAGRRQVRNSAEKQVCVCVCVCGCGCVCLCDGVCDGVCV